ncbi:hypothetical protein JCM3765_007714 [Sporobolomyces pararoseus]
MSLKQELQTWSSALLAFDNNDYDRALITFKSMESGSKIFFNIGLIHATRGEHELAIEAFERSVELDPYLTVAYFQAGVSRFLLKQFDQARRDFDDAWLYLRSNEIIDYEQIGLKFQLYSCEVLFNRGLCLIRMGRVEDGLRDWSMAIKEKYTQEHDVIDEAYSDRGQGYMVFSVSVGTLFRPSESKLANLEPRDFLGKTTVIAAANPFDLQLDFQKAVSPINISSEGSSLPRGKDQGGAKLSRSQTVAARLENSVDGIARPLRRRPTLEERKIVDGRRKRSQTAPLPSSQPDVNSSRPVLAPTTRKTSSFIPSEEAQHVRSASVAEKRNRRQGLTIQVPPLPAPSSSSKTSTRPTYLELPHRRTASVPSPSSTSPRTRIPHLRSASLPSPGVAAPPPLPPSHHHSTSLRRNQHPRAIKRSPQSSSSSSPSSNQNPSSIPQARQNSSSDSSTISSTSNNDINRSVSKSSTTSSTSSSSSKLCLSPVNEENQNLDYSVPSPVPSSNNSGSALLAYMQDLEDEKNKRVEKFGGGKKLVADVGKKGKEEDGEKLRIRLRYRGQIRAMILPQDIDLLSLVERIRFKFQSSNEFSLSFKDSDGCLISLVDEEDWQGALDSSVSLDTRRLEIIVGEEEIELDS